MPRVCGSADNSKGSDCLFPVPESPDVGADLHSIYQDLEQKRVPANAKISCGHEL